MDYCCTPKLVALEIAVAAARSTMDSIYYYYCQSRCYFEFIIYTIFYCCVHQPMDTGKPQDPAPTGPLRQTEWTGGGAGSLAHTKARTLNRIYLRWHLWNQTESWTTL